MATPPRPYDDANKEALYQEAVVDVADLRKLYKDGQVSAKGLSDRFHGRFNVETASEFLERMSLETHIGAAYGRSNYYLNPVKYPRPDTEAPTTAPSLEKSREPEMLGMFPSVKDTPREEILEKAKAALIAHFNTPSGRERGDINPFVLAMEHYKIANPAGKYPLGGDDLPHLRRAIDAMQVLEEAGYVEFEKRYSQSPGGRYSTYTINQSALFSPVSRSQQDTRPVLSSERIENESTQKQESTAAPSPSKRPVSSTPAEPAPTNYERVQQYVEGVDGRLVSASSVHRRLGIDIEEASEHLQRLEQEKVVERKRLRIKGEATYEETFKHRSDRMQKNIAEITLPEESSPSPLPVVRQPTRSHQAPEVKPPDHATDSTSEAEPDSKFDLMPDDASEAGPEAVPASPRASPRSGRGTLSQKKKPAAGKTSGGGGAYGILPASLRDEIKSRFKKKPAAGQQRPAGEEETPENAPKRKSPLQFPGAPSGGQPGSKSGGQPGSQPAREREYEDRQTAQRRWRLLHEEHFQPGNDWLARAIAQSGGSVIKHTPNRLHVDIDGTTVKFTKYKISVGADHDHAHHRLVMIAAQNLGWEGVRLEGSKDYQMMAAAHAMAAGLKVRTTGFGGILSWDRNDMIEVRQTAAALRKQMYAGMSRSVPQASRPVAAAPRPRTASEPAA